MAVFDSKNIYRQYAEIMKILAEKSLAEKGIVESEQIKKAIRENRPRTQ